MKLVRNIERKALELGFDLVGVAPAALAAHAREFAGWLKAGRAAGMTWMERDPDRRADPAKALPGAKSAVVVGLSYFVQDPPPAIWNDPARGRIARYAWGRDYHDVMLPMLEELAGFIRAGAGAAVRSRAYVDTGPVLERGLAERAGLGFVGKNTNLISPKWGSYLFIGEILLGAELTGHRSPVTGHNTCGGCRRCLSACPTEALPEPYVLDARRCIAYLTIEHRGAIPAALRRSMGNWIFGCDECQQVCPWVITHSKPGRQRFLRFDSNSCAPRLVEVMALDEAGFRERFAGTPVMRAGRRGLLRNAAVALGNGGDPEALAALAQAARDADPLVSGHAAWAIRQIRRKGG